MTGTVTIRFITASGDEVAAKAAPGDNLLRIAQAAGLPLEGTCEGQMACSTCHVIIAADWFDRLQPASDEEEDMLDLAAGARRTSRLACQIVLREELDGLAATLPPDAHDMRRS